MNPIVSGVANSAAMIRSPSFSRDSSSVTTTSFPALTASIAAITESRPKPPAGVVIDPEAGIVMVYEFVLLLGSFNLVWLASASIRK